MLKQLHITDFAIIDAVTIDLHAGMTVLTGETGAGKSILLDALGLVLGDRAEAVSVRQQAKRADITATFDISQLSHVEKWLVEQELDSGEDCILRRTISHEGRSKAYINGCPVTVNILKTLGEMLVDIHGQHAHQSLLKRDIQRQRLDDFAAHSTLVQDVSAAYQAWHDKYSAWQDLQLAEQDRTERLDLLRHQAQEFEQLQMQENEWQQLQQEHQRLAHSSKLLDSSNKTLYSLYDSDEALYSSLSQCQRDMQAAATLDSSLQGSVECLNAAMIQVDEAANHLRNYLAELNLDPARLEWLEQRMGIMHDLARKHRVEPEDLLTVSANVYQALDDLEHADDRLKSLEQDCQQRSQDYLALAKKLSSSRNKAAKKLSADVSSAMQTLNMSGGSFVVNVQSNTQTTDPQSFTAYGLDKVELLVSTNPGQTAQALSKVASGGELSRISLAIQMITAGNEPIPTLIFDEVDAGIGGGTAEVVGMHLRALGQQRQVMCVTHLPQVAAQAHDHLRVNKLSDSEDKTTQTRTQRLSAKERVLEVARMLGGVDITDKTKQHAREMIKKATESSDADLQQPA